jgi:hypothetical protein
MKAIDINSFTPQNKIISTSDKFGNTGIRRQQGTTVSLYDTLEITGQTEFRFFEGSSQRNFPLSNTGADGNKLGVGSSMIIDRAYFSFFQGVRNPDGSVNPISIPVSFFSQQDALISEFSFEIANSQVIKQLTGTDFSSTFNKSGLNQLNGVLLFDTQINIQPLLEFVAILRVQQGLTFESFNFLRFTMEGTGAIIAPRTTF